MRHAPVLLVAGLIVIATLVLPPSVGAQPVPPDVTVVRTNEGHRLTVFSAAYLGSGRRSSVLVGLEIDGIVPTAVPPSTVPRELEVRVLSDPDTPSKSERTVTVPFTDADAITRLARDSIRVLARVPLLPGRHTVRIVTRDANGGAATSAVHNVDVPNLLDAAVTMSDLVITSSRVSGLTTADVEEDASLPILGRASTGRRQFSRREQIEVNAEIYDAATNSSIDDDAVVLSVATTLLTPDGRVVYESVDDGTSETLDSGAYGYRHYALVPIETLSPGPYVIRVSALLNGIVSTSRSMGIVVVGTE